ncbi:carboxylating nicotinate-nucleotide diphosphorylase [Thermomonospora curvata]|uniref:Nicotinate-nucleotide pyrophosphorylase [carboxylating] n=1 Tax=Thermomonospora curvata (strain ATCC 19995 / DSM 43183 / JCM 3096 / KCTC 9072 / NBRC 15933 / NCIMB 10081 / Henssen B9) TaxID=471852 RepID=D1A4D7_THECD|nr:nicotinate-nucleotide pyrophosphorylase [Thermomonospora curvata DSM 43183]PKK12230.1 MAG: nicotinate-nucleotide diphosphorylase (carboxylating) [Thermomonospora sp. CIF 1]
MLPDRPEHERWLIHAGLDPREVQDLARRALAEDGEVDVTSEPIFSPEQTARGVFTARQDGVVAGIPVAAVVCDLLGLTTVPHVQDGERVGAGQALMTVSGSTRGLLRAERVALNLLTHLSGIATLTRRWVDAVAGTGVKIRDTRKTLPGLRALQKYAVRCGGGVNHRMGLHDAALIKDNHVAAAGSVTKAFQAVRAMYPSLHIQVECDTLEQVAEALEAGARSILLDNMSTEQMREAVRLVAGRAELEASGGLTLDRARDAAATGVDYLAVGALTHSAPSFDIGLDFSEPAGT